MSITQRLLLVVLSSLLILPELAFGGITNTSNELRVESYQVTKDPQACTSTLVVQVRNNSSAPTDSGLFLHAEQYRSLGGTLRQSSALPTQRVPVLSPGQTGELHFSFIREHDKTTLGFRFMVGPATVAMADGPLPPFNETYTATIASHQLDRAANRFTSSITNTGSLPIPKPGLQLYVSRQSAPTTFAGSGGGIVTNCLMPGASAQYNIPLSDAATIVNYRVQLFAAGKTLDEKATGQTTKPGILRLKPDLKTRPLILQPR